MTINKVYLERIILAAVLIAVLVSALREHDAHILAEQAVKESQGRVAVLEKQVQDIDRAGKAQIAKLQKQAAAVKTPVQAIAAIPEVSHLPLNARPLPDAPSAVQVDAVPLYQELNTCRQTEADRDTCRAKLEKQMQIDAEKDTQIKALQRERGGFWHRLAQCAARGGVGAASGGAFGGQKGVVFGAGLGLGSCLVVRP